MTAPTSCRRRVRAVLACATALLLAPATAHAATIESGAAGDWTDPATWVGGVAPGASDTAVVHHALTLNGGVTVAGLEVEGGAALTLAGHTLTSSGDVSLLGDYYSTSWLSGGDLDVAGQLLIQNTAVSNAAITVTGSTEFSGPLPGDPEASSFWTNSTFTQTSGTATFAGHKLTGVLDPVLDDVAVTVSGVNDFTDRQLTLDGTGTVAFAPTALSGLNGAPLLTLGSLVVSGSYQASLDWSGIANPAGGDRVNLVSVALGDTEDLIATDAGFTDFERPFTGERLYATYVGDPRPVASPAPTVSSSSSLPGHAVEGDTLTCDPGTWTPDGTKVYSWSSDATPINGQSASTFTVTSNELGTDVTCTVAVTSVANVTGTEDSSNAVHVDLAPGNILEPEVSPAQAAVGDVLTCDEGLWSANTPTYAYTWERDGTPIGGATARTYTTVGADGGTEITCSVVATEGLASSAPVASITSSTVSGGPAAITPPSATSNRTPNDRATTGDVITCAPGTWSPDGTKTYEWKRDGTPIATGATYTVVVADHGTDLTCSVTVTANGQSATADSAAVTIVTPAANTAPPAITGTPVAGKTTPGVALTCDPGTWTLSPALTYAWKRGATTVATTAAYTPVDADAGHTLTCAVTATVSSVPGVPVATGGVAVIPVPENTAAPAISGTAVVGEALTCATGSWAGTPDLFVRWLRDDTVVASGSAVYTIVRADRNAELRCKVTASALNLDRTATSTPVTPQAAAPITITARPADVVSTRSTHVAYTLSPDVTVTGCSLNGTALAACSSPIALDALAGAADYALVLNLRNEYGEDETRTVSFATRIGGPALRIHDWTGKAGSYRPVTARFEVDPGVMVACTLDGQPLACTPTGIVFYAPRSGEHLLQVTATDAHGASTTETLELGVKETPDLFPRTITMAAGETIVVPSKIDLAGFRIEPAKAYASAPQVTPVTLAPDNFGLRIKAAALPGDYKLVVITPDGKEPFTVKLVAALTVDRSVGGLTDAKAPLTCTKGSPGTLYSWFVNDKLVRTDLSNELPAAMVPKNAVVECAAIDPEKGTRPREQAVTFDGVRAGATVRSGGPQVSVSSAATITVLLSSRIANAAAAKAKPRTIKRLTVKLKKGKNTVKLGVKLPKTGYTITIKLKKGKRYSRPLVLKR